MVRLEVISGDDAGLVVERDVDVLRIGRAADSHVPLTAHHVSGTHASVVFCAEGHVVRDHHSTNGTGLRRGNEVFSLENQPGREMLLRSGDVLLLGEREQAVQVRVQLTEDQDATEFVQTREVGDVGPVEERAALDREVLRALYQAQKRISGALDLESVIDAVAESVFQFLSRATHMTIALAEEDEVGAGRSKTPQYVAVGSRVRGGTTLDPIPVTRSVFKKVVKERAAVLAADAKTDVGASVSLMAAQILSTIGVPLWQGEDIVGVLQVDNRAASGIFKEKDLDLLMLIAQSASHGVVRARMLAKLKRAEERQRTENTYLKSREKTRRFEGMIGESAAIQRLTSQLRKVVDTRVTVLIEGETGTGKELVASAVHYWSNRADRLFVAQNCAAMPENLLESELFGHKKGAFTGATEDKKGLFELADLGTLFLDEVGEMPLSLQAKLLRVLQEGEVRPVGSNTTRKVDVRIVAATNRTLENEVREGRFREDLYYRLQVFPLRLPPLRERGDDVLLLAAHFLERYAREFGRSSATFSQEASELLRAYNWPGNVRELENEVQRLVIQMDEGESIVAPRHLSSRIGKVEGATLRVLPAGGELKDMMDEVERAILRASLDEHDNNKSATAKTLGITREGLHKKLKKFGMG
ncbi:MAG: sigma 54-interacting transcriptional regulator [Sandaracinaceae bacterium]|jgi:transcriptional regulator with GAF, ATPase, and Fis domain|nr:sigma 54-interacting transcriptional regulator [Sandaracinaceae bacterium]MBP7685777.1 sigma 54-interacting transcriptional regulator [Deltaproteobacteria bacterium]MBK6812183.1 sigma 54-interacting transcriptional regulator [Sandaracinaceae bacterium]MBK7155963.1 sigma 54-interacting transcriptional regulator [Sandaracinaceae bacterium]MBK7778126.1 sigma 54-interacting transcriptional regulator [Sandaracinaceae bacterium]